MMISKPPFIISPPPVPENLKNYLTNSTIQNRNLLNKCFDLKDLVRNLASVHVNDNDDDQKYYLGTTKFMLNFILIPLFLFLVSISLLFTVYFLYNRWVQEIDFQYPKFKLYIYLEIFNTANIQLTSTWMI